jgi:hypothetical protein
MLQEMKYSLLLTLETRVILSLLELTLLFLQALILGHEMLDFGCEVLNLCGENNFSLKAFCKMAHLQFSTALIHTHLKQHTGPCFL